MYLVLLVFFFHFLSLFISGGVWLTGDLVFRSEHSVPTLGVDGSFSFLFCGPFHTLWPFGSSPSSEHGLWTRRTRWRGLLWA